MECLPTHLSQKSNHMIPTAYVDSIKFANFPFSFHQKPRSVFFGLDQEGLPPMTPLKRIKVRMELFGGEKRPGATYVTSSLRLCGIVTVHGHNRPTMASSRVLHGKDGHCWFSSMVTRCQHKENDPSKLEHLHTFSNISPPQSYPTKYTLYIYILGSQKTQAIYLASFCHLWRDLELEISIKFLREWAQELPAIFSFLSTS